MSKTILLFHGWGGNKPEAWQEQLFTAFSAQGIDVRYPKMPEPGNPEPGAWIAAQEAALAEITDPSSVTILTHSLGAITYLHVASRATKQLADRVLLVAPPYVVPGVPPWSAPPSVDRFFAPPLDGEAVKRAARETLIVGGNDDDYATWEQIETYAKKLDIPCHCLNGAGHLSPYWGYGKWPWVEAWALGEAEWPPQPKPV